MKRVFIFSGVILSITLFPGFLYGQGHADFCTSDLWLLKLDSLGDTLWSKTYWEEQCDEGLETEELNDGGFIIAGLREASYGEFGKVLLLKTDSLGDTVWTRNYGSYFIGWKFHLKQSDDGGYWIVGKRHLREKLNWKEEKIWVLKVDSIGDSIWMKSFGHKKYYEANDIVKTNDGDYIIVGSVGRNPLAIGCRMQRLWLLKIDGRGNILWEDTYGWPNQAEGYQVRETKNGHYSIVAGKGSKLWILHTDTNGHIVTRRTYDSINLKGFGYGEHIMATSDGGYILTTAEGITGEPYVFDCFYLAKVNSEGDIEWRRSICHKRCLFIGETLDGGYILTGFTEWEPSTRRDLWLLKIDSKGNTLWERAWRGKRGDYGQYVEQTSDGGYIVVGCTNRVY